MYILKSPQTCQQSQSAKQIVILDNSSNRYVYTYTDIYIYILKSLQTCLQSHIAKHGVPKGLAAAGRPPPTLLAAAANGRRLHVLLYDFVDMSEDSLVCICICLCRYIRIYYYILFTCVKRRWGL